MAISFEYGPPPSALGALSYQAGAGQEAIRRRSEIEAMQMQAAKMRQQQQQAALDRQFNSWKTQYSHHSALDKMQKEFKWREGQAEQGRDHAKEMFDQETGRRESEWDKKSEFDTTMQELEWEERRKSDLTKHVRDQKAAKQRLEQELESRDKAAKMEEINRKIKAAETYNYGLLNAPGRQVHADLTKKIADAQKNANIMPTQKNPDELNKLIGPLQEQLDTLHEQEKYTTKSPGEAGYKVPGKYTTTTTLEDGSLRTQLNPDVVSNPKKLKAWFESHHIEFDKEFENKDGNKAINRIVPKQNDDGSLTYVMEEVPVGGLGEAKQKERDDTQRKAYYDAKEDIYGSLVDKDGDWTPYGRSLARKYFGDDKIPVDPLKADLSVIVTPELAERGLSLPDVGAAGGGAGLSPGDPGFGYTGGAFGAGSPLHETGAAGARRGDPMSLPPRRSERGVMSLPEQLEAEGPVGATYATKESLAKYARPAGRGEAPITGQKAAALAKRWSGFRKGVNSAAALKELSKLQKGTQEYRDQVRWVSALQSVQESQGK